MTNSETRLPERLLKALANQQALQQEQIYFAPVRHHSPACSYAVRQLIKQVKPTHVLIEAPASFSSMLEVLYDSSIQPPIAILCQTKLSAKAGAEKRQQNNVLTEQRTHSAFYPFCDYSPEWQAMRMAKEQHAIVQFIDLPWSEQILCEKNTEQSHSLLSEAYLKHSQYIKQLQQKLHCRDHDEVWEHLFELRQYDDIANWQKFFLDTFIWCAMARLDYEPESLEAEGTSQREQYMLTAIAQLKQAQPDVSIVVVTGGFHTLGLLEGLWQNQLVFPTKSSITQFERQQKSAEQDQSWLIRYSYDRLDALNGYASGMLSPAFYQASWLSMLDYEQNPQQYGTSKSNRQKHVLQFLSIIASQLRKRSQFDDVVGFVPLRSAIEQACLLAELRGHDGPGRFDLLDAIQSAFIKGSVHDMRSEFWQIVINCLSGNQLGHIPEGTVLPPLIHHVYTTLKTYRFKLEDTQQKLSHIDIYRKPEHRQRSRFLHLMAFLEIGFAKRLDGPDYIHGQRLSIMFEDWQYAWTPMVEANLIELSDQGTELEQIAIKKLHWQTEQLAQKGLSQSSGHAVSSVVQAALMGLQSYFRQVLNDLRYFIESDNDLDSLISCGHQLLYLWQGRTFLELNANDTLLTLLAKIPAQAYFLFERFKQSEEEQQQQNLKLLLSLRDFITNLPEPLDKKQLKQDFYQNLYRIRQGLNSAPLLRGAIDGISYIDSYLSEAELEKAIKTAFAIGAEGEEATNYFFGIMQSAPELILYSTILIDSLDHLVKTWQVENFIAMLPNLRCAFSQLTPKQNVILAEKIAKKYGIEHDSLDLQPSEFTENDLKTAISLELLIADHIKEQHLQNWFKQ